METLITGNRSRNIAIAACFLLIFAYPVWAMEEREISFSRGVADKPAAREDSVSMRDSTRAKPVPDPRLMIGHDPVVSRDLRRQVITSMSIKGGGPIERELERNFGDDIQDKFYAEVRLADPSLADHALDGVMTYYFIRMWQTANQAHDYWPDETATQALRGQVREKLLQPGAVPNRAAEMQREAENIMYAIVTMRQSEENALEDHSIKRLQAISDQAQQAMLAQGFDMRNMEFTAQGLQLRQTKAPPGKDGQPARQEPEQELKIPGIF